ncbi:MAG: polysaccharide deacetylase family protein [Oscillospiraceae bacterium]|nr:polysaccharide deacetylase family protein [Oscillospiraceae bacterium]
MKYIVMRPNRVMFIAVAGLCIIVASIFLPLSDESPAGISSRRIPIYNVDTSEKKIAVTFDVAWGNSDLAEILDILANNNALSTFFVTGEWVKKYPEDLKKISSLGHDVQNHSDAHPHVTQINRQALRTDTLACNEKINALLGKKAKYYRAPYGEYDNNMMGVIEDELGMRVIQWNIDSRDWQPSATIDSIVRYVTANTKNGDIALFHVDAKPGHTADALDIILKKLIQDGYEFALLDDLIIQKDYYIDHAGVQRKKRKRINS